MTYPSRMFFEHFAGYSLVNVACELVLLNLHYQQPYVTFTLHFLTIS